MKETLPVTPSARLTAILDLVEAIRTSDRPADGVVSAFVRARRYMGAKDRRMVTDTTWALLRHLARLSWHLNRGRAAMAAKAAKAKAPPPPAPPPTGDRPSAETRALLLAHLAVVEGRSAAEIADLFADPDPHAPGALSAEERRLLGRLVGRRTDDPAQPEAVRLELPDWLWARLCAGSAPTDQDSMPPSPTPSPPPPVPRGVLESLRDEAPVDLRINPLKAESREAVRAALAREGVVTHPGRLSPWALRVDGRPHLAATRAFRDGLVEVQDEGSQLVALLSGATPGMAVLDLCAGAGGKTLALAGLMQNRGRLVATDISDGRLARARERLGRSGIHNVTRRVLDGAGAKWLKRQAGSFDRVLVDAPCSGTGTWRRNPDARWRLTEETLERLCTEQAALLDRAAPLVRPGGWLIYATCSVLAEENTNQITAFLARHGTTSPNREAAPADTEAPQATPPETGPKPGPEPKAGAGRPVYRLLPVHRVWADRALTLGLGPWPGDDAPTDAGDSVLTLRPDRDGTDGFFVALLERVA